METKVENYTETQSVLLTPSQKNWVRINHINLSSLVRDLIDKKMQGEQ